MTKNSFNYCLKLFNQYKKGTVQQNHPKEYFKKETPKGEHWLRKKTDSENPKKKKKLKRN